MADPTSPAVAPTPLTIAANAVGDQPTSEDSLGFGPYVEAIAAFLTSDATQPPLTMSVEGEWGSGKSSFMLQLEKAIRGPSPAAVFMQRLPRFLGGLGIQEGSLRNATWSAWLQRARQRTTIQFNAWRHDKQDALWAAFALKFAKSLRKQVGIFRGWRGDISLFVRRLKGLRGWAEFLLLIVSLLLLAIGVAGLYRFISIHQPAEIKQVVSKFVTPETAQTGDQKPAGEDPKKAPLSQPYEFLLSHGKWGAFLVLAFLGFSKFGKYLKVPLSIDLEKYLAKPDYQGRVAFIETFHEDFARLIKAYAKSKRIFVFIDDLDRCDVPRAAELMQAINLMISDAGKLVFILGMDREKVAAGIAQKYKDLLPFIPGLALSGSGAGSQAASLYFGYSYLEKFIQLSFTLPVMSDPVLLVRFLSSISSNSVRSSWFNRLYSFWSSRLIDSIKDKNVGLKSPPKPANVDASKTDAGASTEAAAQEKRIEYLRFKVEKDSNQILQIAAMVSAIFENNPRKLKQFINTFRLSLYLTNKQGIFDREEGSRPVTPEQLGKFVAITLRFPDLRSALSDNLTMLEELEAAAQGGHLVKHPDSLDRWLDHRGVRDILKYGVYLGEEPFDREVYSLKGFPVRKMMSILPNVPEEPTQRTTPGSMSGSAHGTSSASATLSFSTDADVIRATSRPLESQAAQEPRIESPSKPGEGINLEMVQSEAVPEDALVEEAPLTFKADDDREKGTNGWQRIHSLLSPLGTGLREAYRETLRILLRDGAATERFALNRLKDQKVIAMNVGGIFSQMQNATNLVQVVPGQPESIRPGDREWQIRPELRASVASYLEKHDNNRST